MKFIRLLVIVYVLKTSVCPHIRLCGDIGLGHWIAKMWRNSLKVDVCTNLPSPKDSGWTKGNGGSYSVDWDSSEHQTEVQRALIFSLRAAPVKKSCKIKLCSCRKNGCECGQCQECTNQAIRVPEVHHYGSAEYQQAEAEESSDLDSSSATISSGEER